LRNEQALKEAIYYSDNEVATSYVIDASKKTNSGLFPQLCKSHAKYKPWLRLWDTYTSNYYPEKNKLYYYYKTYKQDNSYGTKLDLCPEDLLLEEQMEQNGIHTKAGLTSTICQFNRLTTYYDTEYEDNLLNIIFDDEMDTIDTTI
jgi:hypothetical protein